MEPGRPDWLAQVDEDVVDAAQQIVDAHHHLWPADGRVAYGVDELAADLAAGHRIVATVFVECGAAHRPVGPDHLRPVGETEFVVAAAAELARRHSHAPPIAGIVGAADLRSDALDETLDAHVEAGAGRFRGVRHALAHSTEPAAHTIPGRAPAGLAHDERFRRGLRRLGERGLTYDSWLFHYQLGEFAALARSAPDTQLVLDHFGTPLGIGSWAGRRDEVFAEWRAAISEVAACPNVVAKLGGLAMPDNGFGWDRAARPATSAELVEAQTPYYHHTIEVFGPDRCMFESNFPVDKRSIGYRVLWNGLQRIAAGYDPAERDAMFHGTARRVYRL